MQRFLVVEGLIGVGKTTLCRKLAEHRQAELVLEPHEDNPFLAPFYNEPERYALPVQMYFLLTRFQQQDRIRQLSLFHPWVVSDYLFEKDRIFAEKTLPSHELELYGRLAGSLGARVPTPDLVIFLHAPTEVLLERVANRGIEGEERIDAAYLDDLARRYEGMFASWDRSPTLHLDTTELDYVRDPDAMAKVLADIEAALDPTRPDLASGDPRRPGLFDP